MVECWRSAANKALLRCMQQTSLSLQVFVSILMILWCLRWLKLRLQISRDIAAKIGDVGLTSIFSPLEKPQRESSSGKLNWTAPEVSIPCCHHYQRLAALPDQSLLYGI